MMTSAASIVFDPQIPLALIIGNAVAIAAAAILWIWCRPGGLVWRFAVCAAILAVLANPTLVREQRAQKPDIAVIVSDESESQAVGDRPALRAAALRHIEGELAGMADLETRRITVQNAPPSAAGGPTDRGTRLFQALARAVGEIPRDRLAGVIAVTDGQIHDAEPAIRQDDLPAPFHVILTGRREETDRRLSVTHAPAFGMVGRSVEMTVEIDDPGSPLGQPIPVSLRIDGGDSTELVVPSQQPHTFRVPLSHAGETIVELVAAPRPNELSLINNQAVHAISGVRDRLRVLLVSGTPHSGERTWRSILKSDPAVDLVHFTILRPPEKQDGTPVEELSLIPFPIQELFELNLPEFDLIVFDRYRRRGLLSRVYLENIVDYIQNGGAFLEASGPTFATLHGLGRTPLAQILPAAPTGRISEGGFRPRLTDIGFRHPVTFGLPGGGRVDESGLRVAEADWGRWFRLIDAERKSGSVLIDGPGGRPLLIVDRAGDGRVAHLLSDHIWLWSRGFDGGGPQAEMLRRTAHWLMKEPDLEENQLQAQVQGGRITVTHRSLDDDLPEIVMTRPDGSTEAQALSRIGPGRGSTVFETEEVGLHRFSDGERVKLAAVGILNPIEFDNLQASEAVLAPVVEATGGGLHWAATGNLPDVRRVQPGRATAGRNWIGLRANDGYVVTGTVYTPLLPGLLILILILGLSVVCWRREGA